MEQLPPTDNDAALAALRKAVMRPRSPCAPEVTVTMPFHQKSVLSRGTAGTRLLMPREKLKRRKPQGESTDVGDWDGPPRMNVEDPVMGRSKGEDQLVVLFGTTGNRMTSGSTTDEPLRARGDQCIADRCLHKLPWCRSDG